MDNFWPRFIQEILVKPHLDDVPKKQIVESWNEIIYLDWILAMSLKSIRFSKDNKYIVGMKQNGHSRMVARLFPLSESLTG